MTGRREQSVPPGDAAPGFDRAGYESLVRAIIARGYTVRGYQDSDPAEPHLILRHDLDMSLEAALPIAETEKDMNVAATYFVLVRGELYNPLSEAGAGVLARLIALGHDIGLHFDATLDGDDGDAALEEAAARECAVLEYATGRAVTTISFHRPAPALLGRAGTLAGRRHAYEPRYFSEMGYCSDSRGEWGHGHPIDHPALAERRALQLLTHPIWWRGPAAAPAARLDRFLESRLEALDSAVAANCEVHSPGRAPRWAE